MHACLMQRERWQFAVIGRTNRAVKAVSGIHADTTLIPSSGLVGSQSCYQKPPINESQAFVTHTEGQSDESVYFQMHEKTTPPRAQ